MKVLNEKQIAVVAGGVYFCSCIPSTFLEKRSASVADCAAYCCGEHHAVEFCTREDSPLLDRVRKGKMSSNFLNPPNCQRCPAETQISWSKSLASASGGKGWTVVYMNSL